MKRKNERAITRVVIATGISSVVTQLLIIREFLAQFQGNEFVIALILFNWLILGGVGTILARWVTKRLWEATVNRLGWLSLVLAGLPAVQILAIRQLRDVFFIHGSSVGFYSTLYCTTLEMRILKIWIFSFAGQQLFLKEYGSIESIQADNNVQDTAVASMLNTGVIHSFLNFFNSILVRKYCDLMLFDDILLTFHYMFDDDVK